MLLRFFLFLDSLVKMIPYVLFYMIYEPRWKLWAYVGRNNQWSILKLKIYSMWGHRQDLPLYPSMRLLPHPNQTPPPPTPTKPLLIPDVANWLTFCCTSPGGANKKFKIPDIHLNVYTLTIIILYDFQVENYKKWPFLVVDFFSSSANFFHTEWAEPFCQELAVLNKPK
jgi:hypothetical protein